MVSIDNFVIRFNFISFFNCDRFSFQNFFKKELDFGGEILHTINFLEDFWIYLIHAPT